MTPDEEARVCPDWSLIDGCRGLGTCRTTGRICFLRDCLAFKYLRCMVYQAKISAKIKNLWRSE